MIEDLLNKQKQLMAEVPHEVQPHALVKMRQGVKIIDTLLRYLNSTGHKPWRPVPLHPAVQQGLMVELQKDVGALGYIHRTTVGAEEDFSGLGIYPRQLISAFGVIEETVEHLNTLTNGSDRQHQLEELVDVLFFYLEQVLLGEFTLSEIEEEYARKWDVNMERYRRAKEGDFGWNHRGEEAL